MKRAGSTALFAMVARASNQIAVIVVTLFATRYLGPEDFGIFALASMMLMLPRNLLFSGPYEYLLKSDDHLRWSSPCCLVMLSISALAGCILAGISPLWPYLFGAGSSGTFLLILSGSILPSAIAAWQESLLVREGRLTTYYAITVVSEVVVAIVTIVMLVTGYGLAALATQVYLRPCMMVLCFRIASAPPPLKKPLPGDFVTVLRWSRARYGSVAANFASNYSSDLMLGIFMGPAATGLYRAGSRIVTAVSDVVVHPTSMMSITGLSKLRANGQPLDGRWLTMFVGIAWFGIPALAGLAVLAPLIAPVALGPQWSAAAPVITVLCVARMFALLNVAPGAALVAYDRQKRLFAIQLAIAIANVCATIAAAPFGIVAVALSITAVTIVGSALTVLSAKRITEQAVDWRQAVKLVLPPTAVVVTTALLGRELLAPLLPSALMLLAAAVALGGLAWIVTMFLLRKPAFAALHTLTHAR